MKDIDKGYKDIIKKLQALKGKTLQAGILPGAGTNDETGELIADYASANEYGIGVPERSFLRSTSNEQGEKWNSQLNNIVDKVIENKPVNIDVAVGLVGTEMVKDIVEKINSNIWPPNSDATIAKKKSSRTLIDTGIMRRAIKYKIVDK
jgi:hypothetical protein